MKKGQESRGISLDFCPETVASVVRIHKAPQVDHWKFTAKNYPKNDCIKWNIPLARDMKCLPFGKRDILRFHRKVKWNKSTHACMHFTRRRRISRAKRISQIHAVDLFRWKKTCFRKSFFWLLRTKKIHRFFWASFCFFHRNAGNFLVHHITTTMFDPNLFS